MTTPPTQVIWIAYEHWHTDCRTLGVFASANSARAACETQLRSRMERRFVRVRWDAPGSSQRIIRPDCNDFGDFGLQCYSVERHWVQP